MTKLKLEVGKYYRTRDGRKVGPISINGRGDWSVSHPFRCGSFTYKADGVWLPTDTSCHDLIAEWPETPPIGTLDEIGAQVGDVVEWVSNKDGLHFADEHLGKLHTIQPDGKVMLNGSNCYWGYIGEEEFGDIQWRIISRASYAKSPIKLSMQQGEDIAKRGPVITETVKRIVPGVYGRVSVMMDGDTALIGWDRSHMNKDGVVYGTLHQPMSRDELTAAIETLTAIRDAL